MSRTFQSALFDVLNSMSRFLIVSECFLSLSIYFFLWWLRFDAPCGWHMHPSKNIYTERAGITVSPLLFTPSKGHHKLRRPCYYGVDLLPNGMDARERNDVCPDVFNGSSSHTTKLSMSSLCAGLFNSDVANCSLNVCGDALISLSVHSRFISICYAVQVTTHHSDAQSEAAIQCETNVGSHTVLISNEKML